MNHNLNLLANFQIFIFLLKQIINFLFFMPIFFIIEILVQGLKCQKRGLVMKITLFYFNF